MNPPKSDQDCSNCGAQIAPGILTCPACKRLVHAKRLGELSKQANELRQAEQWNQERDVWRGALELLPHHAPQSAKINARIAELAPLCGKEVAHKSSPAPKWLASLGVIGFTLWKFKFLLAFVATKGKLLLLGLTKSSTIFSMFLSMGVYWSIWGWQFALGFIVMMYVHEMGHVAALRHLGIRASAPMFVPGLGAFVRLEQYPSSVREEAHVGLAGPIWGLGAALASYGIFLATGMGIFAAIAQVGGLLNLFNLLPFWQLDGARGIRALSRKGRGLLTLEMVLAWTITGEAMLLLVGLVMGFRAMGSGAPETSDRRTFIEFSLLLIVLSLLCSIQVPGLEAAQN
ncbi:MAG: site-2 protease family protein [Planctomycetota bacterium]|nr:site-2 protease family protein [Planctomycetota bacterium]